ncbi:MAG TPA: signal peptidase I [Fimbriimonadaceae bacterium]|nr:signal peptidase I [Fimbriimonadaceae bacterium]
MLPNSEPTVKRTSTKRRAFTGFGAVLLFVLAFVLFFHFSFTTVVVSGQSMLPTLQNGKKVLVSKAYWLVGSIQDGNIVVLKGTTPGEYIIKRVYKMGGEAVDTFNAPGSFSLLDGQYKVPDGMIYVLGDNRSISEDSRRFGPVDLKNVIGKVVAY